MQNHRARAVQCIARVQAMQLHFAQPCQCNVDLACMVAASPMPPSSTQHHGAPMSGSQHCTRVCMHIPAHTKVPAVAHTHTHTHIHVQPVVTQAHVYTPPCASAHVWAAKHAYTCTRTQVYTCGSASRCASTHVCNPLPEHSLLILAHIHGCAHVRATPCQSQTHILEHICVHAQPHTPPCIHPGAHACATPLLHKSTCTHFYMHTHTCATLQTNAHTPPCTLTLMFAHLCPHTSLCTNTCATPSLHK